MNKAAPSTFKVQVWELPLRIFHWLLAVGVVVMLLSANFERFDVHITTGKLLVILLLWRIVWGFIGGSNARFSSLIFRPREYIDYILTLKHRTPGYTTAHSPIGSLAVIAILVALIVQIITGLVATDVDGLIEGPFAYYVSYELSRLATEFHHAHINWVITLLILHLAASAFYYLYKKENLVLPMIRGSRDIPEDRQYSAPVFAPLWKALVAFLLVLAVCLWLFTTYG